MSRHLVRAYGLTFDVPFPCPSLAPAPPGAAVDVEVVEAPVPRALDAPEVSDATWDAAPGRYLVRGGLRAGRYLVEDGARIVLERSPRAEDLMLAVRFVGSVLPALLRQRGLLVLHANAVVHEGEALVIGGASGAGKSTSLAALVARGLPMLSDDVTALRLDESTGRVEVLPGVAELHLTEDSATGLALDVDGLLRQPWRRMKVALPPPSGMAPAPLPLGGITLLETWAGPEVAVERLSDTAAFAAVQACVYGPLLADQHAAVFSLKGRVSEQVPVRRVRRPVDRWSVDEVVGAMLSPVDAAGAAMGGSDG